MTLAIGSFGAHFSPSIGTASVVSDAQLARLRKELSDCINCATADTASGKAKIQAVETRIDAVKARLEVAAARSRDNPKALQIAQPDQAQINMDNRTIANGVVGNTIDTSA